MGWDDIDARVITNIGALVLLLFFLAEYLALAGLNLLAQLSDRITPYSYTETPIRLLVEMKLFRSL